MAVQDYMIHRFIREKSGKATKQEVLEAFGNDEETRRMVEEKLSMMQRFGILVIDGDVIRLTR